MKTERVNEMAKDIYSLLRSDNLSRAMAVLLDDKGYIKQREGKWKVIPDEYEICADEFVCSVCKESFTSSEITTEQFLEMMKYCPNCGAKMKGGE